MTLTTPLIHEILYREKNQGTAGEGSKQQDDDHVVLGLVSPQLLHASVQDVCLPLLGA